MKRIILFYIISLLITGSTKAQDMVSIFINMPDAYIPQLEDAWRKDLTDLFKAGKEARLQNTIGGMSAINQLTEDYIQIDITERSSLEMKLLPASGKSRIICMVNTIKGPVPDSRISFFTIDWEPLQMEDIFQPVTSDWFIKTDIDKKDDTFLDAMSRLDMELIHYQLHPEKQLLTATYTTPQYLSTEDRNKLTPFIKSEPKIYQWKKGKFR